jgi:hypothetical protein
MERGPIVPQQPYTCQECGRLFYWGDDSDSADVDNQGPIWVSCRENAFWKLTIHMKNEHTKRTQPREIMT